MQAAYSEAIATRFQETPMSHRILVTGGTGTIGRALVEQLKQRKVEFAVMSSKPARSDAGVSFVQGDFADAASLERAFKGFDTLFLLLPLVPNKLQLATNVVRAAQAAGIRHIVRSSAAGADPASPVSLARLQGQIDALVAASGIAWTVLRPNFFMQNLVNFGAAQIRSGTVHAPHGESGAQSLVDVRDIADAAAAVLADPAPYAGKTYDLTGPEALTDAEQLAIVSRALGRPVRYVDVPEAAAEQAMQQMGMPAEVVEWLMSLNHVVKQGWAGGLGNDVQRLTGHAPRRFVDFVTENVSAWR
jgi:uncharacterized protein YbjT (DUF2867 family)